MATLAAIAPPNIGADRRIVDGKPVKLRMAVAITKSGSKPHNNPDVIVGCGMIVNNFLQL
jgi:hypothetical protein